MKKLLLLALLLTATVASAQTNRIIVGWDAVPGVDGYRIFFGTATATYAGNIDAGNVTTWTLALPVEGPQFLAVKSYNAAGESIDYSVEIETWPAPEVVNVVADCTTLPAGGVSCDLAIAGFNYAPDVTAAMTYPGVTVISTARIDARSLSMTIEIASDATGGTADLVLSQAWTRSDGGGGFVVRTTPAASVVTPVILPSPPGNVGVS